MTTFVGTVTASLKSLSFRAAPATTLPVLVVAADGVDAVAL